MIAIIVTSACVTPLEQLSFYQFSTAQLPRNWFNYDGFLETLAQVRNNEGNYYDAVHNTHYQHLFGSLAEVTVVCRYMYNGYQ